MEQSRDAVVIATYDPAGKAFTFAYANAAFTQLFGAPEEIAQQIQDANCYGTQTNSAQDWVDDLVRLAIDPPEDGWAHEECAIFVTQTGETCRASLTKSVFSDASSPQRHVCLSIQPWSNRSSGSPGSLDFGARLAAAMDAYPDPIVLYDENLYLVFWNTAYANSITDGRSELRAGMHLKDVLLMMAHHDRYPDAKGREETWVQSILSDVLLMKPIHDVELEGDVHHRLMRSRTEFGDYVVVRLNLTELVRQKRAAEAVEARLIGALNAYPSPFVIYDSDDCLVVWNHAYRETMADHDDDLKAGMHRTEVGALAIQSGKIVPAIGNEDQWSSDEHQAAQVEIPVQDLEMAGDIHHRLLRSRAENGDLVIVRLDTTELVRQRRAVEEYSLKLEKANQEITHQALHDELTGLGNRRYLNVQLEEMAVRYRPDTQSLATLHIDLDRFKQINDTMGHAAGDHVLLETSQRILSLVENGDIVARIGGDEFVVVLRVPKTSTRPTDLAKGLLERLSQPTQFEGKECRFGASIGLAHTPISSVEALLQNSDVALYKAKREGRGQVGIFDQSDLREMRRHKRLADDVLRGLENSEFVPFYQPQVDPKTGKIVGLETLARWAHPTDGILTPDVFLSVATELNLTSKIDEMIFEKAIVECSAAFQGAAEVPSLSFNVSARRVYGSETNAIRDHVQTYPGRVVFELLETIFMEEEDDAFLHQLDRFRELGIAIEVDDFGSGRASVVALQRIAPDRIKVDRRLVQPISRNDGSLRMLRSIIEIGNALNMGVTAEGVESSEQFELLTALGCDRLQGYYIARPMSFHDMLALLGGSESSAAQYRRAR